MFCDDGTGEGFFAEDCGEWCDDGTGEGGYWSLGVECPPV